MRDHRVAAAIALVLVFALQSFVARAELLFRSVEQVNGQQRWSPIRNYANTTDTAYARLSASGAALPAEEVRVFVAGQITREDAESARVMAGLLKSGKQKLAGNSVWLASEGGDIDAAMEVGRLFRRLGIFTLVGRNDQCLSACVLAFMGGERRIVAGRLGIHRPFFPFTNDAGDRQQRFRHLQRVLRDYVEELDFPSSLYEAIMVVPPESMHVVAQADLKRFYLDGISPSSEDLADATSARRLGVTMIDYLKQKAKAPACALLIAGEGRCEVNVQEAAATGGAADDPGAAARGDTGRAVGSGTARKRAGSS